MIKRRPVVIANEIRLKRSQFAGTYLLVERRDDRLFCQQVSDADHCKVIVAECKDDVFEVIRILNEDDVAGVVGLVDPDFDGVLGIERPSSNIVQVREHDLEAMLVRSDALDKVLVELGSDEKIATLGVPVRDLLIEAARPIGALRLHSMRTGLNLTFDGLRINQCIDSNTMRPNTDAIVQSVKNKSMRPDIANEGLVRAVDDVLSAGFDDWQLCCGTDLVGVLSVGLRRAIGTNQASAVRAEELRRMLRLGISDAAFADSGMAIGLREWETRNGDFRILRQV